MFAGATAGAVVLTVAGCSATAQSSTAGKTGKLAVVATTTQVADFVRNVGGDRVGMNGLTAGVVGPGAVAAASVDTPPAFGTVRPGSGAGSGTARRGPPRRHRAASRPRVPPRSAPSPARS